MNPPTNRHHDAVNDAANEPASEPQPGAPALPERAMSRTAAFVAMGIVALAIVLLMMLRPGAGIDPDAPPPSASGTPPPVVAEGADPNDALAAGKDAPLHYTLKDMNGVDVKLASFKGKIILLNFWATWCGPCRAEIPALIELQSRYADDLVVLGFSVDDTVDKLKPYAAQYKINYPVLVGNGREDVQDAFGPLWGIPVSVIIGRDGRIAKKHSGIGTKEQFEQEIKALL
jgi:thiol-disulfide isomerase/thioredoxin